MNSLLKRQIRKYLNDDLLENKEVKAFMEAVNNSYNNFDEQFVMVQRAMKISSEELFTANQKLQEEAEAQKKVINKLKNIVETLNIDQSSTQKNKDVGSFDVENLANFIEDQAQKIVEINQKSEKLLEELSYQNQELSDYAHMISHDLKSPLRSIDTLTLWLYDDNKDVFNESDKQTIYQIRNHVEKMELLINGILEYSTIGRAQEGIYNVDVDYAVNEVLGRLEIPDNISVVKLQQLPLIKGEKYRLQQVFRNLITNAINFNDKKQGKVEIGYTEHESHWEFFVKDNGKGIEEKYFDKIFKTFQKLEIKVGTIGMGLSIAKKIVTMYGGEIWLKSEVGKGTTFYFTIKK
ncbi:histidine kinase [Tamlana nanhaiensis]|uniref:histidine kinase n=1 Tax=Neotamlana nanhaiensis TaxID=1382798 RepID=A0A0D7W3D8_9FLAO|nr:ATP-binding protein [Tamlana nanhaiensis]KJD32175.1 histidine kinase [Tamlana nanhaiensis]KJD32337.1 histidine kinase [Tamlana nanhaiensis]